MTEKLRSINLSGSGSGSGGGSGGGISTPILTLSTLQQSSSSPPSTTTVTSTTATTGLLISGSGSAGNCTQLIGSSNYLMSNNFNGHEITANTMESDLHLFDLNTSNELNLIMNSSQISTISNESIPTPSLTKPNIHITHNIITGSSCRFPKLEECAHFHYERVQLGPLSVRLADDKSEILNSSIASQSLGGDIIIAGSQNHSTTSSLRYFTPSTCWFIIKVIPSRSDAFFIRRSFDNIQMLDEMLHRCVYDRKISVLKELSLLELKSEEDTEYAVAKYLERFSKIASDSLTCGTILTWFQLDNKGRRLPLADGDTMRSINTPAVGAAYGVRRYVAQACDEISIEVGDMISVIDMPSPAESVWWRGKKSHLQKSHYEVGFFPQSCVATIGDKVPRHFPLPAPLVGQLDVSPTKPVLRKHGKLIAFFRSFILSRPSRRRLKQSGIYRERVFSCDLSEHLLNSGQEIPMVLKCCAEFIEENGIVDGIYRLSGITSNIQKLRRAFDEERIPDLIHPEIRQDIHAVSSLLKMYFRELPNPLCTYQLYDNFVEAIQIKSDANERLRLMKETVLKLPPPHYRTLKYLAMHLSKISRHSTNTGMTDKNLAIVWAPNLLRSPALESGGVAALRGVGVQAVVTEYLIRNCDLIFDPTEDFNRYLNDQKMDSLTDCESLLVEQREHDQSLIVIERPKSLSAGGAKLISLEEAQERHSRLDNFDINKSIPINAPPANVNVGSYIEVGGGPSSLPDKYHTVLPVPRSWQKRKTHSWKSLFTRNAARNSNSNSDIKTLNVSLPIQQDGGVGNNSNEPRITFSENETIIIGTNNERTVDEDSRNQRDQKEKSNKSIDLFDGSKPMDICLRSNSVDSLRTAGHSRSVSHDSYFDLLQSPLRGVATCPSRELSELGLNFDREEPEMRIFSESESLVSSPKVIGKENIPPCRRVLRARPEEFSSTANSVNPSPKKQPRLNLLSPNTNIAVPGSWDNNNVLCQGEHNDESCCKRYKLEDQLSDIQFIDCSTPEHNTISNNNQNTVYASVQVHNPPNASLSSKSSSLTDDADTKPPTKENTTFESIFEKKDKNLENSHIVTRYSYPGVLLGGKRKDNETTLKERFSYPGLGNNSGIKNVCRIPAQTDTKMNNEDDKNIYYCDQIRNYNPKPNDLNKAKNRYSYCEPAAAALLTNKNPTINYIFRSTSADIGKEKNEMEISKLSIATPSSPLQSPRYSLLVGETSSENSSAVNTPVFDMDPINQIGQINCDNNLIGDDSKKKTNIQASIDTKDFDFNKYMEETSNNVLSQISFHNPTDERDITALKRELSLDLEGGGSKMSVDLTLTDPSLSSNNKQIINIPPSPNNSNFTHTSDNTSQSITPSEFGYQHLNRQSYAVSSENSPNLDSYDNFENTFYNYDNKTSSSSVITPNASNTSPPTLPFNNKSKAASSPIKATISITYNLKSPLKKKSIIDAYSSSSTTPTSTTVIPSNEYDENILVSLDSTENYNTKYKEQRPLLETSFDENMIYEQVKFFRSSVSEVNEMLLNNGNEDTSRINRDNHEDLNKFNQKDIVPQLELEVNSNSIIVGGERVGDYVDISPKSNLFNVPQDILMSDTIDSLELDDQNISLYENVEMRKPPTVYENIDINLTKNTKQFELRRISLDLDEYGDDDEHKKLDTDSLENVDEEQQITRSIAPERSPSNFSVKQLATKFEKSPVDVMPPFDFSSNNKSTKKTESSIIIPAAIAAVINRDRENAPCYIRAKNHNSKQQLNKSGQITRSLDENAFIREFGQKRFEDITKSVQQIDDKLDETLSAIRRKSLQELTRPKSLNPPKRLPGMSTTSNNTTTENVVSDICRQSSQNNEKSTMKLKLDLERVDEIAMVNNTDINTGNINNENLKITPTTENRICLIQNNVELLRQFDEDRNTLNSSSNNVSSMRVLSGVKLDRERIERIKEERRHQLSEKYRTESFKSKSKTELREFVIKDDKFQSSESLRIKSKSRGDVRSMQKEIDNLKGTNVINFAATNRVRRISDEKNQNHCEPTSIGGGSGSGSIDDFSIKATATKFERKSIDYGGRERDLIRNSSIEKIQPNVVTRSSISSTREKISPQFSIRDVTAMFESRSQNQ